MWRRFVQYMINFDGQSSVMVAAGLIHHYAEVIACSKRRWSASKIQIWNFGIYAPGIKRDARRAMTEITREGGGRTQFSSSISDRSTGFDLFLGTLVDLSYSQIVHTPTSSPSTLLCAPKCPNFAYFSMVTTYTKNPTFLHFFVRS